MLKRQRSCYHFRRKVPLHLGAAFGQAEIWASLFTTDRSVARSRAAFLYVASQEAFEMAEKDFAEAGQAVQKLKESVEQLRALKGSNVTMAADVVRGLAQANARADAMKDIAMEAMSRPPMPPAPTPPVPEPPKGPPISQQLPVFMAWKKSEGGWTEQTGKQTEAGIRLLIELIGDLPMGAYDRSHASTMYDDLRRLPSSHGKGREMHARDAIALAQAEGKPTLALKTVKRHFSAFSQM